LEYPLLSLTQRAVKADPLPNYFQIREIRPDSCPFVSIPTIFKIREIRINSRNSCLFKTLTNTRYNASKRYQKGVQTASKKNFTAKKAFIFVHLMNAFCRPIAPLGPTSL